jgi:pimeloyl-ACP methyl ester carboxylesterase
MVETAFELRSISARDGLRLSARDYARGLSSIRDRLPVVCLAGLTRNSRDFHPLAVMMSGHGAAPRRVVALDYRGRGASEHDKDAANYNLMIETDDVLAATTALGIEEAIFIGTSRGALIIHMLAAVRPAMIAGAVLNDAGPVIEGAGLAQIKGYLERMPQPRDWADAARILRDVHGPTFPALSPADWDEMARAIYKEAPARRGMTLAGDFDPALVRQLTGIDFNTRLPTLWPQFDGLKDVPLMTVRGANSALLSESTVAEMTTRHPGMDVVIAAGQGHAPLLHVEPIAAQIMAFLAKVDQLHAARGKA